MTSQHRERSLKGISCFCVLAFTLITSASSRAEGFDPPEYLLSTGILFLLSTTGPFYGTTENSRNGRSKHYAQGVKDDAAAYLATDGAVEGALLESAWREYLEQGADVQSSKSKFAHRVLAT